MVKFIVSVYSARVAVDEISIFGFHESNQLVVSSFGVIRTTPQSEHYRPTSLLRGTTAHCR